MVMRSPFLIGAFVVVTALSTESLMASGMSRSFDRSITTDAADSIIVEKLAIRHLPPPSPCERNQICEPGLYVVAVVRNQSASYVHLENDPIIRTASSNIAIARVSFTAGGTRVGDDSGLRGIK